MKKAIIAIVAVIVLAGGGIAVFLMRKDKTNTDLVSVGDTNYVTVKACDVLTDDIAKQVIGSSAVKGSLGAEPTSDGVTTFDTCIYNAGPDASTPHTISVAVRSAKNRASARSNRAMFAPGGKPTDAEDIKRLGNAAYWDPGMSQLNILKGNNWYIVTNYTGTAPANGTATRDMAEQLAKLIVLQ